jgi:pimeloyl-ACP methyl ester carboxylesterase
VPVATFLLIPGAGGQAWYWHRVTPLLVQRGHRAIAVQLPADDGDAGLEAYAAAAVAALPDRSGPGPGGPLVVVGQSMGGFTAPLVCARTPVDLLVLLNAMTPRPGESGGEWWAATGQQQAAVEFAAQQGRPATFDPVRDFFHDVPDDVTAAAMAAGEPVQSDTPFLEPWPLTAWPTVPTRFIAARDDRLFPLEFQRRVVHERLGIDVDEVPGGHLVALSHPDAVAARLLSYAAALSDA